MFGPTELKSRKAKKVTSTFHICTRERMIELLSLQDIIFWKFISYVEEEVHHQLCSLATVSQTSGTGGNIKGYGWREENGRLVVKFNNHNATRIVEAHFSTPILVEEMVGHNNNG